ncbi:Nicotinamidase-related amidase [Anaerocolumna jejuensis DSM 15929]|uniref:Nicotinamidase-related amidase n=1 Tax=Anaerocolumna jejuensis DSM 15929 TaxID=1121322 RepID=A0A1M6LVD9_9FIRM|nr:isochorismatase family cysteine hydrolase [Anaerocolumna jejuensis]SHJ75115.1 Nicotinamidase-related amidase [Anaerocolumna jejuensis DSM 15929]
MIKANKDNFLKESGKALEEIYEMLQSLKSISLEELQKERTVLIMVDLINGFTREGALKSPRVERILPSAAKLQSACLLKGFPILAFADSHSMTSPEFASYPPHCLTGTSEEEIAEELQQVGGYQLIRKNSTNGFLEEAFSRWLKENDRIDTFLIVGDCTDICIQQFAETLKTWFNKENKESRIIVPMDLVETYELGMHNGNLVHVMALYNMTINGVEVVQSVEVQ